MAVQIDARLGVAADVLQAMLPSEADAFDFAFIGAATHRALALVATCPARPQVLDRSCIGVWVDHRPELSLVCALDADADKRKNWDYYETMLKLVRPGGLILIDNVLFYGRVADPEVRCGCPVFLTKVMHAIMQPASYYITLVLVNVVCHVCQDDDKKIVAIRELNQRLLLDERITLSIVPVGDGIAICRRR